MEIWEWVKKNAKSNAHYNRVFESLDKDRYTVQEAADIAQVHVKTMRDHIKKGKIVVYQPSDRKTWVHKADLATYLSRRAD